MSAASVSHLLRYIFFFFVDAYYENMVLHRYILTKRRSASTASMLFINNTAIAPKIS